MAPVSVAKPTAGSPCTATSTGGASSDAQKSSVPEAPKSSIAGRAGPVGEAKNLVMEEDLSSAIDELLADPDAAGTKDVAKDHEDMDTRSETSKPASYVDTEEEGEVKEAPFEEVKRKRTKGSKGVSDAVKQRLLRALWPTHEQRKDFKERAGVDPDPTLLLGNLRFRDGWREFDSNSSPSSKERSALRRLAIDITRRSSAKGKASTSKSQAELVRGNKRKNRSSSFLTERGAPTTSSTPKYKIPKIHDSGNKVVSAMVPVHKETDIIEGSEDEVSEIDVADLDEALPSHADVVRGKKPKLSKQEYPNILWIHSGNEDREQVTKEAWKLLYEKLEGAVVNLVLEGKTPPRIDWHGFKKGTGIIAPVDEVSRDIVKELVASIQVDGSNFRAWSRGERSKYTTVAIRVPTTMTSDRFTAGKLLQVLTLQNKLPEDKAVVRSCHPVSPGSKERVLRIGIMEEVIQAIVELNGYLYLGAGRVEVHLDGSRLTQVTPST